MKLKYKYIYDKKSGHFIRKLNEDDNTTSQTTNTDLNNQQNNNTDNQQNNTQQTTIKFVDTNPDIQTLNTLLANLTKKYNDDIAIQTKTLDAAKLNASKKQVVGGYDPVMTDSNVLTTMKKINDIKRKYNTDVANLEDKRIQTLLKLSQMKESYYKLPEKYKYLNESNIHTAKIYMKNLIGPDNTLKGMVDFKRVFKDTNLLYGKDRDGYFIVALDSDDFNEATEALEEVGYLRDEVLDTIMPQILDRHLMIL